jgi:broad specificity phosphatase PhoE
MPLLSLGAAALSFLMSIAQTDQPEYIQYTTLTGFFLQDDPATNPSTFDYTAVNFGLINRTYDTDGEYDPQHEKTQWQRFDHQVFCFNRESGCHVQYKVLFMGRHGEGYHNAAETFYGTPAWNCYWAELDGNATVTWADAHLTPNGITQAQIANNYWRSEIIDQKIPTPESYYTSPLSRCLETANITFFGLDLPTFIPEVKELFREGISIHTCDRRSNKTYIHNSFPTYTIEPGFTEYDELWNGVTAESSSAQDARSKTVLDQVFSSDDNTYLSITSHSGEIASILRVLGHQVFGLNTGEVIPVLVKAETISGDAPRTTIQPWTSVATCNQPPATNLATGGCVCSASATPTTA